MHFLLILLSAATAAIFSSTAAWGGFQLHDAAQRGDLQTVKQIVEEHRQVDVRNARFQSALHLAVGKGQTEVVLYLLSMGANPNSIGPNRWTPLHYAALQENPEILTALLEKGGNLNQRDYKGYTPLHYAYYFKNSIIADAMVKANANPYMMAHNGLTPLDVATGVVKGDITQFHLAIANGDLAGVAQFLTSGVPVDLLDEEGYTGLHIAAERGHLAIVNLLLDYGADPNRRDQNGNWPPILFAVWEGHLDILKALVAKGAKIDATDSFYLSAAHYGAAKGRTAIVEYVLDLKPELVNARDFTDWTPLHYAAMNNTHIEVARLLLDRGADLYAQSENGETPIDFAEDRDFQEMTDFLLARGEVLERAM